MTSFILLLTMLADLIFGRKKRENEIQEYNKKSHRVSCRARVQYLSDTSNYIMMKDMSFFAVNRVIENSKSNCESTCMCIWCGVFTMLFLFGKN